MIKFDKKQFLIGIVFFPIMIILYLNTYFHEKEILKSIRENKVITVGKVYKFIDNRSYDYYYYCFYHKGSLFYDKFNKYDLDGNKLIDRFFYLEYSSKNPNFSLIDLEKEITNSVEIKSAGFILY